MRAWSVEVLLRQQQAIGSGATGKAARERRCEVLVEDWHAEWLEGASAEEKQRLQ